MTSAADALPLLALRVDAGPLTLCGITDDLLGPLVDLAVEGIHDAGTMPFYVPWSTAPADELGRSFAQYHWRQRAGFSVTEWSAELAVVWDGEVAGVQSFSTRDFLVTRSGETGSWLGRRFQGRGIGTAMRQVVCAFVFDHIGAEEVVSGAFTDNPASQGVSRKVGYVPTGTRRMERLGKCATVQGFSLAPEALVRYAHPLEVAGLPEFRASVGLGA